MPTKLAICAESKDPLVTSKLPMWFLTHALLFLISMDLLQAKIISNLSSVKSV